VSAGKLWIDSDDRRVSRPRRLKSWNKNSHGANLSTGLLDDFLELAYPTFFSRACGFRRRAGLSFVVAESTLLGAERGSSFFPDRGWRATWKDGMTRAAKGSRRNRGAQSAVTIAPSKQCLSAMIESDAPGALSVG